MFDANKQDQLENRPATVKQNGPQKLYFEKNIEYNSKYPVLKQKTSIT